MGPILVPVLHLELVLLANLHSFVVLWADGKIMSGCYDLFPVPQRNVIIALNVEKSRAWKSSYAAHDLNVLLV